MDKKFIKKYWADENVLFYIHFENEIAIRQIEISSLNKIKLTIENPINGDSILFDQELKYLELEEKDYISEKEFNLIWELK